MLGGRKKANCLLAHKGVPGFVDLPRERFNPNPRDAQERLQQVTGVRPFLLERKRDKLRGMKEEEGCCRASSSPCRSPTPPDRLSLSRARGMAGTAGPGCDGTVWVRWQGQGAMARPNYDAKPSAAPRSRRRGRPVPQRCARTRLTPGPSPPSLPPSACNGSAPPRRLGTAPGAAHSPGRGARLWGVPARRERRRLWGWARDPGAGAAAEDSAR